MAGISCPFVFFGGALSVLLSTCCAIIPLDVGLGINVNAKMQPNFQPNLPTLQQPEQCKPTELECRCGIEGRLVSVTVPQCSYGNRWKLKCKPCDKKEPKDVCPKFLNCQQCHLGGGDQCASCPLRKFGNWCENDCLCENGAECDRSGNCLCPTEFEGQRCERRKGCSTPYMVAPPLQENRQPPDNPVTVIYSCPSDYVLRGSHVITCLPDKRWSGTPPQCLRKCPLLNPPNNGRLEYTSNELVEGVSATITCGETFQLIGESTLRCLPGGVWSSQLPSCKQLSSCPDPGLPAYSTRAVESPNSRQSGPFVEGTNIHYFCPEDYQQMGASSVTCLAGGSWSDERGICIKVSNIKTDCKTHGKDIIAEIGVPVRILCPPECANGIPLLWGTSIYKKDSTVCPAAVHAGIVTNSGGLVDVINNGEYSYFVGSNLNNVLSQSFDEREESFRFNKVPPLVISKDKEDCPKRLVRLQQTCAYVSNTIRSEVEAEAICKNLGLQLHFPDSDEEQKSLLALLREKEITKIWTGKQSQEDQETSGNQEQKVSPNIQTRSRSCEIAMAASDDESFTKQPVDCQFKENFVCFYGSNARALASCDDQGPLTYGKAVTIGKIGDIFYVGSSVEYSCDSLHYMRGAKVTYCSANGTWTAEKPTCVRVNTCEEPPVPIGGVVNYLAPLRETGSQRSTDMRNAITNARLARIPVGLGAPVPLNGDNLPASEQEEIENIELPPGVHRVGTRAMYDCQSRYYQLVGSRIRRCETRGNWSGRAPTCMPVCGRSDSPRSPFVVNGNASDIGQWPWQSAVARYLPDYNQWFIMCGGSLLNERWVITAAHCVTYAATTLPIDPDKFQVYVGKYHRSDSKDDENVQVKKVLEIHIHPDYDPNLFDADIALLQLETAVQFSSRVQPVCLPTEQSSRENLKEGRSGVVTGWGMNENETYSETLMQAVLPVVSHSVCEKGYEDSRLPLTVTENMFCAGFARGKTDACSGDSGGPMVFLDEAAKEKRWILEGIVSWGSPSGCGHPNQYGGFTTVSKFLDWIHLFF